MKGEVEEERQVNREEKTREEKTRERDQVRHLVEDLGMTGVEESC